MSIQSIHKTDANVGIAVLKTSVAKLKPTSTTGRGDT
jgi:hypothetical protein